MVRVDLDLQATLLSNIQRRAWLISPL